MQQVYPASQVSSAKGVQYKSFKGTAREFIQAGVTINSTAITQPGLSLMAQYGVAKIVGEVPRPEGKRGHPEKIYQIVGKSGLRVDWEQVKQKELETA